MKKVLDFFVYSCVYIAICALVMCYQTMMLFRLPTVPSFLFFVFFATLCSYNFHWYFTQVPLPGSRRVQWSYAHKAIHVLFFSIGLLGIFWWGYALLEFGAWLAFAALLTFIYSAPKIPVKPFVALKKFIVGKTIFLAITWTYVTVVLPIVVSHASWTLELQIFTVNRFFLIYAICILFDYRDRKEDKAEGIRSLVTQFDDNAVNGLFMASLLVCLITTAAFVFLTAKVLAGVILLLPAALLLAVFPSYKKTPTDYGYYLVLDGLMMLSGLLLLLIRLP